MSDDVRIAKVRLSEVRAHGTNVRKDLGDLRDLTDSISRFGVMHPIVVEQRGDHWRLRDGHRRVAAAQILGIQRVPAVIHTDALEDDEWLTQAVHANQRRRQLDHSDRVHAVTKMREAGMTWEGIAREFGLQPSTVRSWLPTPTDGDRTPQEVEAAKRHEQVEAMTADGASAAQIADRLGITQRSVVRHRTGTAHRTVATSTLRRLLTAWREQIETGHATATELLDALDGIAETGRVTDYYPPTTTREKTA